MIAALNDLEVKLDNILNAYEQLLVTGTVKATLGPGFGKDAKKTAVIVRALYSLKSTGAAFRSHLARWMESLGYQFCRAGKDLWLKSDQKMGYSNTPICCVMWMTSFVSITMQMLCYSSYKSPYNLSEDLAH